MVKGGRYGATLMASISALEDMMASSAHAMRADGRHDGSNSRQILWPAEVSMLSLAKASLSYISVDSLGWLPRKARELLMVRRFVLVMIR